MPARRTAFVLILPCVAGLAWWLAGGGGRSAAVDGAGVVGGPTVADREAELGVPTGPVPARESADPRGAEPEEVGAPEAQPAEPAPGAARFAVVRSRRQAAPLPGAFVTPLGARRGLVRPDLPLEVLARADHSGALRLAGDDLDGTRLFRAPGFAPVLATFAPQHAHPDAPLEVLLPEGAVLEGTLTLVGAAASLEPREVVVVLRARIGELVSPPWSLSWGGDVEWHAPLDGDGRFRLAEVFPGTRLEVEVRSAGALLARPAPSLRLREGETERVDWEIGHTADVHVRFLEADAGLARGLDVYLDEPPQEGVRYERSLTPAVRPARTGDDGSVLFAAVPEGRWCVGISSRQTDAAAPAPAPEVVRFEVPRGVPRLDLEVVVHRGLFIQGIVLDWEGRPVKTGVQAIGAAGGSLLGEVRADGRFSIGPLLPGEYTLNAGTFGVGENARVEGIPARAGDTEVVVQLQRGAVVGGVVLDQATRRPLACKVTQSSSRGGGYTSHVSDGVFHQRGVVPGECTIRVKTEDGRVAQAGPFPLAPGERREDLEVLVAAPTFLEVAYSGVSERVFARATHGGVQGEGAWVQSGAVTRLPAVPGPYELLAEVPVEGGEWSVVARRAGTVLAGEVARVDL